MGDTNITPLTKRIGMICLTLISIVIVFSGIEFKDALLVIIPCITSISAMVDGGK